jgi:hypothetical protein
MSVILSVGFSLNTLFLRNLRTVGQARDSMTALYAADSGTETCLYETRSGTPVDLRLENGAEITVTDIATGTVVTDDCSTLGTGSFQFRVTGHFRQSSRAGEISQ